VSVTRDDPKERKRVKQYGERFVQIKKRLCDIVGTHMAPSYWLPASVLLRIRNGFFRLSIAFDELLYREGRKRTRKDFERDKFKEDGRQATEPRGEPELERHNMISYNFLMHELTKLFAPNLYERAQLEFFFPLPRTPKVLEKLTRMYNSMAHYCGYPPSMLTGVADKRAKEWTLDSCLSRFPPELQELKLESLTEEERQIEEFERQCEEVLAMLLEEKRNPNKKDEMTGEQQVIQWVRG
jgi:hypothetical protein